MNAAIWLGTAIFYTFGVEPACFSADMRAALGVQGQSYFNGAIASVAATSYYHVALACGVVALLHLLAHGLYFGRQTRKFSLGLVVGMFLLTLLASNVIQPAMTRLNRKHYTATETVQRESAAKSFRILHVTSRFIDVLIIGGLIFYVWRVGSPSDTLRFVRPVQYRG